MTQLSSLRLRGWKSIRDAEIELRPLNILIGANGAGKSNLVGFFKLISEMMKGRFQIHVATTGGAESLLHYGSKWTKAIDVEFRFATDLGRCDYTLQLVPAAENKLVFEMEKRKRHSPTPPIISNSRSIEYENGHLECQLTSLYDSNDKNNEETRTGEHIRNYLSRSQAYHFHDTSPLSPMRRDCSVDSNRFLASDAGNLPAMLYLYRERYPTVYRRIVAAVKAVAPFFDDFVLEPLRLNPRNIALHWRAKDSVHMDYGVKSGTGPDSGKTDYDFGPHQLSDGTLRAIALFTLLLQPEEDLPELIVLDEPELGLHPAALAVLADLLKSAANQSQLLIATQSTALIDHFDVEDIVTVNLRDGASTFDRLDPEGLKDWLEDYTLSELWERNAIGGGPY